MTMFEAARKHELEQCEASLQQLDQEEQAFNLVCARVESRFPWTHRLAVGVDGHEMRLIDAPEALAKIAEHELRGDVVFLPNVLVPTDAAPIDASESLLPFARKIAALAGAQDQLRGVLVIDRRAFVGLQSGAAVWKRDANDVMYPRLYRTGKDAGQIAPGKVGFRPDSAVDQVLEFAWDTLAVVTRQRFLVEVNEKLTSLTTSLNQLTQLIVSEQDNKLANDLRQFRVTLNLHRAPSESELRTHFEALGLDSRNLLNRPESLADSSITSWFLASIQARVLCVGLVGAYGYDAGLADEELEAAHEDFGGIPPTPA